MSFGFRLELEAGCWGLTHDIFVLLHVHSKEGPVGSSIFNILFQHDRENFIYLNPSKHIVCGK